MIRKYLLFSILIYCFNAQGQYAKDIVDLTACPNKTLSLSIHIVLDTADQANVQQVAIDQAIADLNAAFTKMCVQFAICKQDTIRESMYDNYDEIKHKQEMGIKYDIPNTINLYFVINSLDGMCGKAPMPNGYSGPVPYSATRDFIFIKKSCPDALTHEIGHYFGLQHTFEKSNGLEELADGSNCKTAGDLICDTEADPYPKTQIVPGTCKLDNASRQVKDNNGDFYTPPICNIMSYYKSTCTKYFTPEQFNLMLSMFHNQRSYLW